MYSRCRALVIVVIARHHSHRDAGGFQDVHGALRAGHFSGGRGVIPRIAQMRNKDDIHLIYVIYD